MKLHQRITGALLSAAALLSLSIPLSARAEEIVPPAQRYTDVDPLSWYSQAVEFCRDEALMNGVSENEFDPMGTMTRGMLATVLYRMEGSPEVTAESPFDDVDADSWYGPAVIWAAGAGLVEGYGGGVYAPDDRVTREQLAAILWRYDGEVQPDGVLEDYLDENGISDWASQAVDWSAENGIILCLDLNYFSPKDHAMRCELAHALMNFVNYRQDRESPVEDEEEQEEARSIWAQFEAAMGYQPTEGEVRENAYDMTLFAPDARGYMTYAGGTAGMLGIDVSSHQKEIDWGQVAAAGVEFAIIRVGYRGYTQGTLNEDAYFRQNITGALNAGLKVGVYFFSQAVTVEEALEEADYTLSLISGYPISFPVVFDWEEQDKDTSRTQGMSEDVITACALAFCERVKAAGYTPMFYASPSKAYKLPLGYLAEYPFWLAHYTKDMIPSSYKYHFDIWQYTSKGSIPGIEGNVDVNICMANW